MDRDLALDSLLQRRRQSLIGSEHVGEVSVAGAAPWHFEGIQDGSLRRHIDIGHIGMPDGFAGAKIADWLAVLDDVGDNVDLWKLLVERLAIRIRPGRIEFAKLAAERKK